MQGTKEEKHGKEKTKKKETSLVHLVLGFWNESHPSP